MTYSEIHNLLRALNLEGTLSSLERAVEDEAHALSKPGAPLRGRRDAGRAARAAAQEYYAEDITRMLQERQEHIAPGQILHSRRLPTAWAIAQFILQEDPKRTY